MLPGNWWGPGIFPFQFYFECYETVHSCSALGVSGQQASGRSAQSLKRRREGFCQVSIIDTSPLASCLHCELTCKYKDRARGWVVNFTATVGSAIQLSSHTMSSAVQQSLNSFCPSTKRTLVLIPRTWHPSAQMIQVHCGDGLYWEKSLVPWSHERILGFLEEVASL